MSLLKWDFLICDLHRQLEKLHAEQFSDEETTLFTVYRGQSLSSMDFQKLIRSKSGLMSFNNFLSTSNNREISLLFAESILGNSDMVGILFKITIDPSISYTPYAFISSVSNHIAEEEILFSMHSVFRIGEIEKIDNNDRLYEVELKLITDDDQQLRILTNLIKEKTYSKGKGWYRMSMFLISLGQYQQAEDVCMTAQEELYDDTEKMDLYNILGRIKCDQGDYEKALFFRRK
jgi:tetratricopeptide (TPR) repeat protein